MSEEINFERYLLTFSYWNPAEARWIDVEYAIENRTEFYKAAQHLESLLEREYKHDARDENEEKEIHNGIVQCVHAMIFSTCTPPHERLAKKEFELIQFLKYKEGLKKIYELDFDDYLTYQE